MGLLVNIEGADRSGKDTQLVRVVEQLRAAGLKVTGISIPDRPKEGEAPGPRHFSTGILLDRILRDKIALIDGRDQMLRHAGFARFEELLAEEIGEARASKKIEHFKAELAGDVHWKLAQVVFSINRRECIVDDGGLNEQLKQADIVLVGRYLSAYVYGPATGVGRTQLNILEGDLPQPDINFLMDIDPAVARARRADDAADVYEANNEMQSRVRQNYSDLVRRDAEEAERDGRAVNWVRVDATLPMEQITDVVVNEILKRAKSA